MASFLSRELSVARRLGERGGTGEAGGSEGRGCDAKLEKVLEAPRTAGGRRCHARRRCAQAAGAASRAGPAHRAVGRFLFISPAGLHLVPCLARPDHGFSCGGGKGPASPSSVGLAGAPRRDSRADRPAAASPRCRSPRPCAPAAAPTPNGPLRAPASAGKLPIAAAAQPRRGSLPARGTAERGVSGYVVRTADRASRSPSRARRTGPGT